MFAIRAGLFAAALIFLAIGRVVAEKSAIKNAVVPYFLGVLFGIIFVTELWIRNPNEWLWFKLLGSLLIWLVAAIPDIECAFFLDGLVVLLAIGTFSALVVAMCYKNPVEHVERVSVNVTYLVATNDAYEITGSGQTGFGSGTFSISENGVYRYYYIASNGMKAQGKVNADVTYIDDTLTEGQPYLEELLSYDIVYGTYNRERTTIRTTNKRTWYELHVPAGSIVESYTFDLQ